MHHQIGLKTIQGFITCSTLIFFRSHTQIQDSIIFLGVLGVDNADETVIWLPMVYIATNRIIYNGANKK